MVSYAYALEKRYSGTDIRHPNRFEHSSSCNQTVAQQVVGNHESVEKLQIYASEGKSK